jgi:hypothetical protein
MKYRKKPVEIDAIQYEGISYAPLKAFIEKTGGNPDIIKSKPVGEQHAIDIRTMREYRLVVETLEGDMRITQGDYLIRGVNGEYYPCKPDIFAKTYEKVD